MLFSFFFVRARIGPKKWGGQFDPPPGKPRMSQHPGKGGVNKNSKDTLNVELFVFCTVKCYNFFSNSRKLTSFSNICNFFYFSMDFKNLKTT